MHQHYKDILDRIDEPPKWFDDRGVPRFQEFSPRLLGNIYSSEAALAEVSCQRCHRMFRVALTNAFAKRGSSLSDEIRLGRMHYGDPPNVACCAGGPSMNSVMHKIVEYWSRDLEVNLDWQRDPTYEGPVAAMVDPPDTLAECFEAVGAGAIAILIMCTSQQNRYDLAGRIAAKMATAGRVLITYPENYLVVAHKMLDGLVPSPHVGRAKDGLNVTLADFSRVKDVHLSMIKTIIVLAAPRPRTIAVLTEYGEARRAAEQKLWSDAANWLSTGAGDKVKIELALVHSRCMVAKPDVVIDAGRIVTSK